MMRAKWMRVRFWIATLLVCAAALASCGDSDDSKKTGDKNPPDEVPANCGNGVLGDGEVCDGALLSGETCETQGGGGGTLACRVDCRGFDLGGCQAPETCGDGSLQAPEVCDGADLGGESCASLGFDVGELGCAASCMQFDTTQCERAPTGTNNPPCVAKSCADLGAQCGSADDGCGGTLSCGACDEGLTCGGGGTPNVCGATCRAGCPAGYTCDDQGVCRGGEPGALVLDVPVAKVTLSATINGQTIRPAPGCGGLDGMVTVYFTRADTAQGAWVRRPCQGPLTLNLPHGVYEVDITVTGSANVNTLRRYEAAWRLAMTGSANVNTLRRYEAAWRLAIS